MKSLLTIFFLSFFLFYAFGQWQEIPGYKQTNATSLLEYNGVFFAGIQSLGYRSFDGEHWQRIPDLPSGISVSYEFIQQDTFIFALQKQSSNYIGLFVGAGQGDIFLQAILPSPSKRVFISGTRIFRVSTTNQLSYVDDFGLQWIPALSLSQDNTILDIIEHGTELILVSSDELYASSDNGTTWTLRTTDDFGGQSTNPHVADLFSIGGKLFCGSLYGGTLVSNDNGQTWNSVNDLPGGIRDLEAFGGSLFATLELNNAVNFYESNDSGVTWQEKNIARANSLMASAGTLFLSTQFGILSSTNGIDWKSSNKNIGTLSSFSGLEIFDGRIFIQLSSREIFQSPDLGQNWYYINQSNQGFSKSDNKLLFPPFFFSAGVQQHEELSTPDGGSFSNFAFCASDSKFFAIRRNDFTLWESADDGTTWSLVSNNVSFDAVNNGISGFEYQDGRLHFGTYRDYHFSDDEGLNWTPTFSTAFNIFQYHNLEVVDTAAYFVNNNDIGDSTWFVENMDLTQWAGPLNGLVGNQNHLFGWYGLNNDPRILGAFSPDGQLISDLLPSNPNLNTGLGSTFIFENEVLYGSGQGINYPGASIYALDLTGFQNGLVQGTVFLDENANGVKDPNEKGLSDNMVAVQNTQIVSPTDSSGDYSLFLWSIGSIIKPTLPSPWFQAQPLQYSLSQPGTSYDFAIQPSQSVADLQLDATYHSVFRPGFSTNILADIENLGTLPQGGTLKITLPSDIQFSQAIPTPSNIAGNVIEWLIADIELLDGENVSLTVQTDATVSIGTPVVIPVEISTTDIDANPSNNEYTINAVVVGSYDPNDKAVLPENFTPSDLQNGLGLKYTIRFQNTGNYPASFVRIRDTIDNVLDISTLKVLGSSHEMEMGIINDHIVEFFFKDINLPDSLSNPIGSNGFVSFSIAPNKNLSLGTTIPNRAAIYFDFNPPIITNYANSTFQQNILVKENSLNLQLLVYPNPAHGDVNVIWDRAFSMNSRLFLKDHLGRNLSNYTIPSGSKSINLSLGTLPSGFYYLSLESGNKIHGVLKFIHL